MHSWQSQTERMVGLVGMYQGGTWVLDFSSATQPGGAYTEWDANAAGRGKTTWGNTLGHNRDATDYVNATQWLPFDLANPADERMVFTNGSVRGLDTYDYTGTLPKKMSRLNVNASAPGGVISGKLDRYAVLTYQGWVNKPLAEKTVDVTAGGTTVQVTTAADGSFSANLGLGAGSHQVTVSWAGDDRFAAESRTGTVTV